MGGTHKEVISFLQSGIVKSYAVLLFLCLSTVCLSSSCSSFPIKFQIISIFHKRHFYPLFDNFSFITYYTAHSVFAEDFRKI